MIQDIQFEPIPEEIGLSEIPHYMKQMKSLRDMIDQLEDKVSVFKKELDDRKNLVLGCLQKNNMDNFKLPGVLAVSVREETFVAQPQSQEDIDAFNQWLKDNDKDSLRKVNSQTLNALYRELNEENETGIVVIPGLPLPKSRTTLTIRKG